MHSRLFSRHRRLATFATASAVAIFVADASLAQNRGGSHTVAPPRAFGVQRGGLGVTGPMPRPSQRPAAYQSVGRTGYSGGRSGFGLGSVGVGARNLAATRMAPCGPARGGSAIPNNSWHHPRMAGRVPGLHVNNGCVTTGGFGGGAIIGHSPGACYPRSFGYRSYGFVGGYGWRYPLYSPAVWGSSIVAGYPAVYGDVFEPLSADLEMDEAEAELAYRAWEDRMNAALQSRALSEFGERHMPSDAASASPPMPRVAGLISPQAAETSRQVGMALGRGDEAFEAGKYDLAREEYIRALVLAGEDASVRIALGLAEYALGSFADAAQAVRRGVARAPGLAASEFDLRAVYGKAGDFAAHLRILEDHVAANPEDIDARFLLGFVKYFSGDREEGRRLLAAYLADPQSDGMVREFIETAMVAMPRHDLQGVPKP